MLRMSAARARLGPTSSLSYFAGKCRTLHIGGGGRDDRRSLKRLNQGAVNGVDAAQWSMGGEFNLPERGSEHRCVFLVAVPSSGQSTGFDRWQVLPPRRFRRDDG